MLMWSAVKRDPGAFRARIAAGVRICWIRNSASCASARKSPPRVIPIPNWSTIACTARRLALHMTMGINGRRLYSVKSDSE
jgi:hypothetical protein